MIQREDLHEAHSIDLCSTSSHTGQKHPSSLFPVNHPSRLVQIDMLYVLESFLVSRKLNEVYA